MRGDRQLSVFQSGIRDNRDRGTVGNFLEDLIRPGSRLSFVSAYFTIYAFEALQSQLESVDNLRFLFGEPRFVKSISPPKDAKVFSLEDNAIALTKRLSQHRVARDCAEWIRDRVEIRSVLQSNLLHGKLYHIETPDNNKEAIIGSSNFTVKGLGFQENSSNIELNLVVCDRRDLEDLKKWFDETWDNDKLVEDVKERVLNYLEQIYRDIAPEFVYYKTLFHLFDSFLRFKDENQISRQSQYKESKIWNMLFQFQRDGVEAAIEKILAHNGCILADSVGLGKTFEALAVIKYFQDRNEKILVLCPKKLRSNWTTYLASGNSQLNPLIEDRLNYTVLSHTDLTRTSGKVGDIDLQTFRWDTFDLVVIDESHNFRNDRRGKTDREGNYQPSRYEFLLNTVLKAGVKTKVLLLSATPVNNDLQDLRNQLTLIAGENPGGFAKSLEISDFNRTILTAKKRFKEWSKKSRRDRQDLMLRLNADFFKLLDGITLARSRKHIERYYADTVKELGGFPERLKPISVYSDIDIDENFMDYSDLYEEISAYQLSLFNPSHYVLDAFKQNYEGKVIQKNFTQANRENYLIAMMRMNFLKRLESSIASFKLTLERTIQKIRKLEEKIDNYIDSNGNLSADETLIEVDDNGEEMDEETQAAMEVGSRFKYQLQHLDLEAWKRDLSRDRKQLYKVFSQAKDVDVNRDAKLKKLKQIIEDKVKNPTANKTGEPNQKVLVFTAFSDTAKYLYDALKDWSQIELDIHIALVTGSGNNQTTYGDRHFEQILTNFSPRSKNRAAIPTMSQDREIDLLIATDCISEGQNLQDCDYLVNYDIHWNPVRIVQRFGRIDRIGSLNPSVQLINFWPTEDLDGYINLKNRVEARMALVDLSATAEDNLLEMEAELRDELSYRDRQLLQLKEEAIDLEDLDDNVSLTEFTLEDFRLELMRYLDRHRQELEEAPSGMFAVVPTHPDYPIIQPGVLFCLKQIEEDRSEAENQMLNPLQPYFLAYVRDDGEVRYSFTQPKQILELWQVLCSGKTEPYEQLCRWFDRATENGENMTQYSQQLDRAIASIRHTYQKKAKGNLLKSGKRGILPKRDVQIDENTAFELITWLVISRGTPAPP